MRASGSLEPLPPRALTIAGSDSGGGAGIQADLKTFQELGVYGMSAITAVTAQNSLGVHAIHALPPEIVAEQIDTVLGDIGAHVIKTGMLLTPDIVEVVADAIRDYQIEQLIVDPVLYAKDGSTLLKQEAAEALRDQLLPLTEVVTPNVPEACALLGVGEDAITTVEDMIEAAQALLKLGPRYVLLKGGHLPNAANQGKGQDVEMVTDVLVGGESSSIQEPNPLVLRAPRVASRHTHGTGCTTASALAAMLALGHSMPAAAAAAKEFVTAAIQASIPLGRGTGSLWHAAQRQHQFPSVQPLTDVNSQ